MKSLAERMDLVVLQMAEEAWARPLKSSGLWHHHDIRNNFYDAAYLFAAAIDKKLTLSFDREAALNLASSVFMNVLSLQDQQPDSPTLGHWPLHLGEDPKSAEKNTLPAELMGCLMVYWHDRYELQMTEELATMFERAMEAMYKSGFYRQPQKTFSHHEAKYTSLKLLFGTRYQDSELLAAGRDDLRLTIQRVQKEGMAEYGALPWFWHWMQSLTCAFLYMEDSEVKNELASLLELLWNYRADHYLNGAWIGGRMRSLPVDLPREQNVAFDYVQFGDFELPKPLLRVEFAGILHYEASEAVRQKALNREPRSLRYTITPAVSEVPLRQSIYRTQHAATGGLLERVSEFDNEQHRWEVTLPLSDTEGANRLYLFTPGDGYNEGDPRHEGSAGEMFYHKHTVMGLYGQDDSLRPIVGVLPKGSWVLKDNNRAYVELQHLYIAVFMPGQLSLTALRHYVELRSQGHALGNGYVVEVIEKSTASDYAIHTFEDFTAVMEQRQPQWELAEDRLSASYVTIGGDEVSLSIDEQGHVVRRA
ncbi:hypothetical protein DFQ01_14115 [Paenibacillus cellulosilyticus]|uniref:Heparinase II/III-like protein n=1 Tax=Paenibacillus cellulosilyticus TaxID=375489 RepID=A0A2V2YHD6_9BACL|nr:hypothetical protein [Paenibacillus cellulosilyticus]PWV90602.1 hypothetical protein DFQ01_14115 [Paenibacillus cellulosilyticus]QKS45233.1 hypothetical protein HUB94_13020 [Paenibacillus cellulosilyticus]